MRKEKRNINIRIFLLALFVSYFVGVTFFSHQHIVDGVVIVHSHFTKQPFSNPSDQLPDHEHNTQAIHLIASISSWITDLIEQPELPHDFWAKVPVLRFENPLDLPRIHWSDYDLRGPPAHFHLS